MSKVVDIKLLIGKKYGLYNPSGICYDKGNNTLYISDMQNKRIVKFDMYNKSFLELPAKCDKNRICLKKPLAITLTSKNQLLITDAEHNCIFKYEDGFWNEIEWTNNTGLYINLPGSIASDSKGNIFFSDFLNNRIINIDLLQRISVVQEIKCLKPYGICIYNDILYVTDTENNRILWLDLNTRSYGISIKSNFSPIAITADEDGDIYISGNRKIYLLHQKSKDLELILDINRWHEYNFTKLCHIGALKSISKDKLIFSDTIKNCIYTIFLKKS